MLVISIDGACRRNGKPDCVAAGGVFVATYKDNKIVSTKILSNYEVESTNQRGELLALLTALDHIWVVKQEAQIITDSEYLFNAMTKEWYSGWFAKDWITVSGDPVKNKDIWQNIRQMYLKCVDAGIEIAFYHIKGHCIPFGKVTANGLIDMDTTGLRLLGAVYSKYDTCYYKYEDKLQNANLLSQKNNGFFLEMSLLRRFVVMNVMADAIATKCVDAADALMV